MSRSRTLSRAVAAALAIAAIAAPSALARPLQDLPTQAPQDFRMPDTKDAAALSQQRSDTDGVQTSSLAGTTSPKGDVYWSYAYPAQDPKTAAPAVVRTKPAPGARDRRRQRRAVGHDRHRPRRRAARSCRRCRGLEPHAPLGRRRVALR